MARKAFLVGITLLLAAGAGLAGSGLWLAAKSAAAQVLLQHAWERTRTTGEPRRPWPWADTRALARLEIPALGVARIILDGSSGRTLAFGPGRVPGTSMPGDPGPSLISAHRDSHFRFLADLRVGDLVDIERPRTRHRYRVERMLVVNLDIETLTLDPADDLLVLVTCFPFDAWTTGGSRRYVVVATPAREARKARGSGARAGIRLAPSA